MTAIRADSLAISEFPNSWRFPNDYYPATGSENHQYVPGDL